MLQYRFEHKRRGDMIKFQRTKHDLIGLAGKRNPDQSIAFLPTKHDFSQGLVGMFLWSMAGAPLFAFAAFFHFFGPDPAKVQENLGALYFFYGLGGLLLFIGVQSYLVGFRKRTVFTVADGNFVITDRKWIQHQEKYPVASLKTMQIEIRPVVISTHKDIGKPMPENLPTFWVWFVLIHLDRSGDTSSPPELRFRIIAQDHKPRTNHIPPEVNTVTTWFRDTLGLEVTNVAMGNLEEDPRTPEGWKSPTHPD
jgi:hypothetical protein